ncbi:hypothetical protein DPMN_059756 [Dreissena polymorpha]|uniref:CBS domain-containing protein n=2 Tax=Dreissena polymorpha TaxID=45954 RepID=A0A9D4HFD6_DREPO|nr:hypothetical protein DPMN_059756 [Dreissena polymorpha]
MTPIEDVFMLDYNDILSFETMSEIMKKGYSRIPVYENSKQNIVALLNIKDLALIDPDDNTPLKTICKYYQHHLLFVFDDHKLDQMLQDFRQGHSHMAIVRCVITTGPGDPYYETLGVVTLEDVIEEIIQSEILDETDTLVDNKKKMPRMLPRQDFSAFNQSEDDNRHILPPQMSVAAFQFLSTSVELFGEKNISDNILKKLIKQNIVVEMNEQKHKEQFLYKEGVPCDYFVLILQGHVEVSIGKENLVFLGGPFTYYGVNALKVSDMILNPQNSSDSIYVKYEPYIPDFSLKAVDNILFLRIKRTHYIVARRATLMGRHEQDSTKEDETFTAEWKHATSIHRNQHKVDASIEVHEPVFSIENIGEQEKPASFSSNWTPLPSTANITGMIQRTDSKDSGWSFPNSEKPELDLDLTSKDTEIGGDKHASKGDEQKCATVKYVKDNKVLSFHDNGDGEVAIEISAESTPLVTKM